jgi:hypothetical protein
MYNKLGLTYENTTLGKFQFCRWFWSSITTTKYWLGDDTIPASLTRNINSAGGQYIPKRIGGSSCIQGQWRINPYLI